MATEDGGLLDLLSEMLTVERDGQRLYELVLADAPEDLRPKLIEYAEQSRRGVLILEEAVRRLGGDPEHVSNGAEVARGMTEAVLRATEEAGVRRWMYRALHLLTFETRDRMIWRALDAFADTRGGPTGEVLKTAAAARLSEEAIGAHGADRNEERVAWIVAAMDVHLADELGIEMPAGIRRGLRRPR